jgi:phenylacetate 2-hydroxylase
MSYFMIAFALLFATFIVIQFVFKMEQPKIKGIPEIPGWPIVGNLLQLGSDHAAVCMKWAEKYGPVFQVR